MTLADAIECPILVNIGMADTTCPYDTIMPVFDRIRAHKSLLVYPDLPHSPCTGLQCARNELAETVPGELITDPLCAPPKPISFAEPVTTTEESYHERSNRGLSILPA